MAREQQAAFLSPEQALHQARAEVLSRVITVINSLDDERYWDRVVNHARDAGLDKEALRTELPFSWSTITRWMAGQTVPGPFVRQGVKAKLIQMLERLREEELSREHEREYA